MSTKAIVLAAGKGVRMKSDRAKVLHEVLGAPVIAYVLDAVRPVADPIVVVGYQADEVRKAAGAAAFVEQVDQRGTGHAVLCCEKALAGFDGDVFVLAGDAPLLTTATLKSMLEVHHKAGADATFLSVDVEDSTGYGRVLREGGRFAKIVEHADANEKEREIREINSGAYVFRAAKMFEALRKVGADNAQKEYYLPDALRHVQKVAVLKAADGTEGLGVNSRRDLAQVTRVLRRRILERHMDAGVTIVDPDLTFIEDGVTIGADAIIHPFTVLRRGVSIAARCHVGPFAHLRAGAVLEEESEIGNFVEVKKSRIGRRSKAKHLTYLGDATLGADVNIGAGTITANYDGKHKHETIIEDRASTGSNTVLVAPVRLGAGAKTGAGAVVPRGEVPAGAVVVGVPARRLAGKEGRGA